MVVPSGSRAVSTRFTCLCLLTLIALSVAALGQASYTAQVRGVVTDQTGAAVVKATVTITNDGTNISSTARTDERGLYILTGLRPDKYTVKVEATGFQAAESKNVVLAVDQQATLNYALKPSTVAISVLVTEAPPLLDTENASIGTDVTNEYVRDIPLYNRSFYGLVFLAGGVTEATGSGINDNYPAGTNFVSNGQRNATAQVTLDGSPTSAPEQGEGGNSNVYFTPSVEIVQEFKVQNNSFSAEFGNNGGTVLNVVLKQGTNQFHGSGWWYGQRSAFDARDYFNHDAKPDHVRDQYGFSVGGPIRKNRTFFFFDFEKVRQKDPLSLEGVVPTDLERAGDFSQSVNSPGGIFDPCPPPGDPCVRTQFQDGGVLNKIPESRIDPIGRKILDLYPHATIPDAAMGDVNWRQVALTNWPSWQFDIKLDHQINANHRISGRYSRHHDVLTIPTIIGSDQGDGVIYTTNVHNSSLEYNWSVTPTMLWTSRFSLDRVKAPGVSNNYPTLESLGFPADTPLAGNGLTRAPSIIVDDGFLSIYTQCCVDTHFAHSLFSYSSGLQWVKGRHSLKVGGEQRVFFNNFWQPNYPTGTFNFARDMTTAQPNADLGTGDNPQGNPFATILTGFAYDGSLNLVPSVADKSKETAFYFQDDWKVTPKLTINAGLRYEWSTPYTERHNRLQFSNFAGDTGYSIPIPRDASGEFQEFGDIGAILGTTVFPTSGRRNGSVDRNNFAPRLGFAYQLASNTVLRGGAGIFYGMNVATNFQYAGPAFQKSANIYFTKDNYDHQFASLADPFPAGLAQPQGTAYGKLAQWGFGNGSDLDTGTVRNAEIYQWNIGVQHLLPWQIVLGVDYSASHSTHLPWAGAGGISTRERNFLPSSVRSALVEAMNPSHDPNDTSVTDYLNGNVPNPFQCFFVPVATPGSWCPATPIFNPLDVVDSRYLDDTIPQSNLLRPFPQFDGGFQGLPVLGAISWYNSLQVRFQKRTSHNISFEGNYTYARAKDNSSSGRNAWIGNLYLDNPQVLDNLSGEYSVSANDATHRLTTAFIVDLPIGRGRWLGKNMSRVMDAFVGGWSLYNFLTIQSGQPLAIVMANNRLVDGNQRPNVSCSQLTNGISYREAARTEQPYLNQACFTDPGDNIPGNAPRYFSNLRSDGIRNLDMSLSKEFKIREGMLVQIRAEVFDVANHQRFAFPDTFSDGGSFGNVTSTAAGISGTNGSYRKMQFGARFQF